MADCSTEEVISKVSTILSPIGLESHPFKVRSVLNRFLGNLLSGERDFSDRVVMQNLDRSLRREFWCALSNYFAFV